MYWATKAKETPPKSGYMNVRDATEDDIEAIRAVARVAWEADYPGALSQETIEEGVAHWYGDAVVAMELSNPGTEFLVAVEEESIIGFAHANEAGPVGTILRLHVHPTHRDGDVPAQLFEAAESALDATGESLRATALTANDHMIAFYEGRGFEQQGTEETTIGGDQYAEAILERL